MSEIFLPDKSVAFGQKAADMAADALEQLGSQLIQQKAFDVASQISIYLKDRHFSRIEELRGDSELESIAVVRIGKSGYTALHSTDAMNIFHLDPHVAGRDMRMYEESTPSFWKVLIAGLAAESGGFYDWPTSEGHTELKYMYCVPIYPKQIFPLGLVVAATIFIDEYLYPSREIRKRILTLSERVDEYTQLEQVRNQQLQAVNDFSRKISSILGKEELLKYTCNSMHEELQVDYVRIFLIDSVTHEITLSTEAGRPPCRLKKNKLEVRGFRQIKEVAETGKPYVSNEFNFPIEEPLPIDCKPSRVTVPIRIGKNTLGVLDLISRNTRSLGELDLFTIWPMADQIAICLENARLHSSLQELAVVEERNRIAREIHDTLAQGFAGISMHTEAAKQALEGCDVEQAELYLERIRSLAKEKLLEARKSVLSLRPNIQITEPLKALILNELQQLEKEFNIETSLTIVGDEYDVSSTIKHALFRIAQENINNIKKHAHASKVHAELRYKPTSVEMLIKDNGVGFNPKNPSPSNFGLIFMSERAKLIGGTLSITSKLNQGVRLLAHIPI